MMDNMSTQWDKTHLCRRLYKDDCEYFLQTGSIETVLDGHKLAKCCYYCTSENKVRKIGSGGSWTGLSPKFCPKRRELEENNTDISAAAENKEVTTMAKFDINAMLGAPTAVMPEQYTQAAQLHAEIINCARTAQENLYQMAMGFKKMRDEKLYIALGYDNFGDYCENETGMKRRNVYTYISVIENLPQEFVQSTAQIGKEKLYLLSTISDTEREEIVENTDLESTTVKELKEKIKELESKKTAADKEAETGKKQLAQRDEEINRLKGENIKLQGRAEKSDKIKEEKERLEQLLKEAEKRAKKQPEPQSDPKDKEKIASLEAQIKELESRPIDVVYEKDDEEINRLKEKISQLEEELENESENGKKESDIKVFTVRLTMDEFEKLIGIIKTSGNSALENAVTHAEILRI